MKIIGKTSVEISDCIRERVQSGQLLAGDSLPPVRELAESLGVNRNTVAAAYQRLAKAGIAITKGRLGTSICAPQQAGEQEGLSSSTALIDLADGNPNPQWLPELQALLSLCHPETFSMVMTLSCPSFVIGQQITSRLIARSITNCN